MAFSSVIIAAAHLGRLTLNDSPDDSDRGIANSHSSRLHHSIRVRATEGRVLVNELSITGQARRSRPQTSTVRSMQWTNDREQPPYSQYYDHPAPYRTPNYVEPPLSRPGSGKIVKRSSGTMKRFTATSGIGIIINIRRFASGHKERAGTEIDAKALWDMFKYLGVTPYLYNDWSRDDILNLLECIAKKNYDVHCLMIAILSHGGDGYVLASDGKDVFINEMVYILNETNCPCFKGKPKVFIIQACRGSDEQKGVSCGFPNKLNHDWCDATDNCIESPLVKQKFPDDTGFLYAYSTIPGFVSHRNIFTGSVFISHLVKTVRENAHQQHLSEMFTEASGRVAFQYETKEGYKQMPDVQNNTGMRIYMRPLNA